MMTRALLVETQPNIFYFTDHYRDWPIVLLLACLQASREVIGDILATSLACPGIKESAEIPSRQRKRIALKK